MSSKFIMNTRYTLPVISIVTDYDNFFDKSTGIYVNGNYENREKSGKDRYISSTLKQTGNWILHGYGT